MAHLTEQNSPGSASTPQFCSQWGPALPGAFALPAHSVAACLPACLRQQMAYLLVSGGLIVGTSILSWLNISLFLLLCPASSRSPSSLRKYPQEVGWTSVLVEPGY